MKFRLKINKSCLIVCSAKFNPRSLLVAFFLDPNNFPSLVFQKMSVLLIMKLNLMIALYILFLNFVPCDSE